MERQQSIFYLNTPSPEVNLEFGLLDNLRTTSVVNISVDDYNVAALYRVRIAHKVIPLPASLLSWNQTIYGSSGSFGDTVTFALTPSYNRPGDAGECQFQLQTFVSQCEATEYILDSHCQACPEGSACNGVAQTQCQRGQYSLGEGNSECALCSPGSFQSQVGQNSCDPCAPGEYQDQQEASNCVACPAGTYGLGGSTTAACDGVCNAGFHCAIGSTNPNATVCGIGRYCPEGTNAPITVDEGYYTLGLTAETRESAVVCEAGYACSGNGERVECSEGFYQDMTGQASCKTCPFCPLENYRHGCAVDQPGECRMCQFNASNHDQLCGVGGFLQCSGKDSTDVSLCCDTSAEFNNTLCQGGNPLFVEHLQLSVGGIAGTVLGVVTVVAIALVLIVRYRNKMKRKLEDTREKNKALQEERDLGDDLYGSVNVVPYVDNGDKKKLDELDQHNRDLKNEVKRLKEENEKAAVFKAPAKIHTRPQRKLKKEFEAQVDLDLTED